MKAIDLEGMIDRYILATFTLNRHFGSLLRESMGEMLTIDQYNVIRYIYDQGKSTSSELAENFCVGKSSITAIVTRLAAKGLIRRIPDDKDRRVVYLTVTEEGERLSKQIKLETERLLSQHLQHFSQEEAIVFIETLEKLARVVKQSVKGGESGK